MEYIIKRLLENKKVSMSMTDSEHQIERLLNTISDYANRGHSFTVVIDPDDSEYRQEFFIDGDGSDRISDIHIEEEGEDN